MLLPSMCLNLILERKKGEKQRIKKVFFLKTLSFFSRRAAQSRDILLYPSGHNFAIWPTLPARETGTSIISLVEDVEGQGFVFGLCVRNHCLSLCSS